MKKTKLILMRHGESQWNHHNIFTGWVDIPLSLKGVEESIEGGKKIADIPIDVVFVSSLIRAQMTAMLALAVHKSGKVPYVLHPHQGKLEKWAHIYSAKTQEQCIPVITAWELNERMYGQLQGMNKDEMRQKFGPEQVHRWRRSYNEAPPEGESLAMTAARSIPYFKEKIVPYLHEGKNVFISAHGNSLRSIAMYLERLSEEQVVHLEIPTGAPLIYTFSGNSLVKDV
ncbi:MAG TPA: 2,3-bisphosphoglycerate-dependent phosphoglycerate mutase [Rhabdochlamydiaceae bacterium]|jgi:2,3-bisphosphoglycerate-dependent phosphoglycerate mutase